MIFVGKTTRRFLPLLLLAAVCLTSLTGCFDLGPVGDSGEEGDFEGYYDRFGEVTAIHQTGILTYDVEDSLFNDDTVNRFQWDDEDDAVSRQEYIYLAIPMKESMTVESLALYAESEQSAYLSVCAFYLTKGEPIPTHVYKYDDPPASGDPETASLAEGETGADDSSYDDLPEDRIIARESVSLQPGEWSAFLFSFKAGAVPGIEAEDGDTLLLRFENNSGFGREKGLRKCEFRFTNLLIRCV